MVKSKKWEKIGLKTVLGNKLNYMDVTALFEADVPEAVINGLGQQTEQVAGQAGEAVLGFVGNPALLIGGLVLVVAAVLIFVFLKKVIVNSILGIIAWGLLTFVFGVNLPFIPSLAVSIIFGLAGIGAMLVLRFFGLI